jgi:hypothetical protein
MVTDVTRYMRWKDAIDYANKNLEEIVRESRQVNSKYQNYLAENPYKEKRKQLNERKEKTIQRIIDLSKQGYEKYDGK